MPHLVARGHRWVPVLCWALAALVAVSTPGIAAAQPPAAAPARVAGELVGLPDAWTAGRDVTGLGRQLAELSAASVAFQGPARRAADQPRPAALRELGAAAGSFVLSADFVDVCGDDTVVDLRRAGVFVDVEQGITAFDLIGCAGRFPDVRDVTFLWAFDIDADGNSDRVLRVQGATGMASMLGRPEQEEGAGNPPRSGEAAAAFGDWPLVWQGTAGIDVDDRGRVRVAVEVPDAVLSDGLPFAVALATSSVDSGLVLDRLPEGHEPALQHPVACGADAAVVAVAPSQQPGLGRALMARGFHVTATSPDVLRVLPVTPSDRDLVATLPGVRSVERPVTFQLAQADDDEPAADDAVINDSAVNPWALEAMRAPSGWAVRPAATSRIAILDDGVDARRPDLRGRVLAGWDAVNARPLVANASSDRGGHGTSVAGVAAALRGNGLGVVGMNPAADLVPVRVSDAAGCIDDAALVGGLTWLADQGVDVVNISLGGPEDTAVLKAAVATLSATGTVLVGASGNDPTLDVFYPAAYDDVIAVGGLGPDDIVASYSTGGPWLDVVAPAGAVDGGVERRLAVLGEDGTLRHVAGTSFAAPQVAGALSLWLGRSGGRPGTAAARLAISTSARDLGTPGHDDRSGAGALDLAAMLDRALPTATDLPGFDGDPTTVDRFGTSDVAATLLTVSRERFAPGLARHAVIVGSDRAADAIVAAPLLGSGPLLVGTSDGLSSEVVDELARATPPGALVYLVGGVTSLPDTAAEQIRASGRTPRRLAGPTRIGTALAVADEVVRVGGEPDAVLVLRAAAAQEGSSEWADAVALTAWSARAGLPILLSASDTLSPEVKAWLHGRPDVERFAIGGFSALDEQIVVDLSTSPAGATVRRIAGSDRAGTAAAIARTAFRVPTHGWRWYLVVNGRDPAGWAHGLAAAGLAADVGANVVLVDPDGVPATTHELVAGCPANPVELLAFGGDGSVSPAVSAELGRLATTAQNC